MKSKNYQQIENWLTETYLRAGFKYGVIAVSGGIDSAVSLTLLTKALGADQVFPVLLPHANQEMSDALAIVKFNQIPEANIRTINIQPAVMSLAETVGLDTKSSSREEKLRLGNIMARARMIVVYDLAKQLGALVCGTENKSEKHLGYFTRFGDEASDVEPLQHLYKTEVRELAQELKLPDQFLSKSPSAGLWSGQTDEQELGFSYEVADQVLIELIEKKVSPERIKLPNLGSSQVFAVINRVKSSAYKLNVPKIINN